MCLAVPARVVDLEPDSELAVVALGGLRKEVSTALVDNVRIGDYVLIHVGFALNTISETEAQATLELMRSAGMVAEQQA